jgi:hypothetical protein
MNHLLHILNFLKNNNLYLYVKSNKIRFVDSTIVFGHSVVVKVFNDGTVCISFNGKQSSFEKAFGQNFRINTFQLLTHENGIVLFSGHKFVYFVFENDVFSKIEFYQYQSSIYKCFVKKNLIVLCAGKSILSFIFEGNKFTKRYYPIRHVIDGGILTFVERTPYFVCYIHPRDDLRIVVSINLISGQQNTVVEMTKNSNFGSFKHRNGKLYVITTSHTSPNDETEVNPLKINKTHESWRQDGGILWENLFKNFSKHHQSKIIFKMVLEELMEKMNETR